MYLVIDLVTKVCITLLLHKNLWCLDDGGVWYALLMRAN